MTATGVSDPRPPSGQDPAPGPAASRRTSRSRAVRTVVANDLRRLSRDRTALFFVVLLPFILIVAIGSFIPADDVDVVLGVVDEDAGGEAERIVEALGATEGFALEEGLSRREAERDVRIGQLSAAVVLPEGFSRDVASGAASVVVLVDPADADAALVQSALSDALGEQARLMTVQRELEAAGADDPLDGARAAMEELPLSEVEMETLGGESQSSNYAFVAAGQMLLFMFVNSLTAGAGFIEMRRYGILGRALAGPVDGGDMLLGLGVSRFTVAGALAVAISVLAALVYGVDWGGPAVILTVIVLFGLVCAGASMLIGSLFDEPDAAVSVGIPVGLGMAALGGCMFPIFLAPEAMQVISKVLTPHAWALDAILGSAYDGDSLRDVWPNLVVLAVWAAVLIGVARTMARRRMRRA